MPDLALAVWIDLPAAEMLAAAPREVTSEIGVLALNEVTSEIDFPADRALSPV